MAPDEVETFTPGGIGATLSPTSVIFLMTTPSKGARMLGELQQRLLHLEIGFVLLDRGLLDADFRVGGINRILRHDFAVEQPLLQTGLAFHLRQIGFGILDIGFRLGNRRHVVSVFQTSDDFPAADDASLFHPQFREATLNL